MVIKHNRFVKEFFHDIPKKLPTMVVKLDV